MSWKAEAHRLYEARVVKDILARLAGRLDLKSLPFSDEELQTFAERARESFLSFRLEKNRERLDRYKAHLSTFYGEACVGTVSAELEKINNAIGYEEK